MNRKIVGFTLAVMMAASLLAGCGSESSSETKTSSPEEENSGVNSTAAAASSAVSSADSGAHEPVTLTFWGWTASDFESEAIQNGINDFQAKYPYITVDYMTVPSADYHTKLKTALASGSGPDVFYLDATQVNDFTKANLLKDLTDVAGDFTKNMTKASLEKVSMTDADGNTHVYGLDICNVGPVIFYNKDLFEEAGVDPMPTKMEDRWTWDEFVENMRKLTKTENGETVQYGTCNWQEQYSLYVLQEMLELNGTSWYNDDMTEAVNVDSEETREVLNDIKALRTEGIAPDPNAAGSDTSNSPTAMFLTGKVASIAIGSYALQEISKSDINYGVGLFPTFGKDDADAMIVSADMKAINAQTDHPDEALLLAEFMSSPDFGIPIYQTGLWMPNQKSLYEEANIDKWFNTDVYPKEWRDLIPIFENAKDKPTDKLHNVNAVNDAVDEELQAFYYADQDIDTTLTNIQTRINEALSK